MQGEAFDWMGDAGSKTRFATSQVLTDQTLAWLQDSGWCVPSDLHCTALITDGLIIYAVCRLTDNTKCA